MPSEIQRLAFFSCVCLLFALVFSGVSPNGFVSAEEDYWIDCEALLNNTYFNLTSLIDTQIIGHDANNQWNFYLQMCRAAPACHRDGSMACQQSRIDPNTIYNLAYPNDNINYHYWSHIPGGIQLTAYGSGTYCSHAGDERKTVIQIYCNNNSTVPTTLDGPVVENPSCTYTMRFNHSSGCELPPPPMIPPKTCPTPPVSELDQSKVTVAGFFTGGIVGAVVALAVYFGYMWYKRRNGGDTSKSSGSTQWNRLSGEKSVGLIANSSAEQDM